MVLRSFYDRIVRSRFRNGRRATADILARLVCYKGYLPQGAPTSTGVANLVALDMDHNIMSMINRAAPSFRYTRFVDDITISTNTDIRTYSDSIYNIIRSFGFDVSKPKTHYTKDVCETTGIIVSPQGLSVPQHIFDKLNNFRISEGQDNNRYMGVNNYILRVLRMSREIVAP